MVQLFRTRIVLQRIGEQGQCELMCPVCFTAATRKASERLSAQVKTWIECPPLGTFSDRHLARPLALIQSFDQNDPLI